MKTPTHFARKVSLHFVTNIAKTKLKNKNKQNNKIKNNVQMLRKTTRCKKKLHNTQI